MKKLLLTPLAIAVCLGLGWTVYQHSLAQSAPPPREKKSAPVAVEVTTVMQRDLEERVDLVGTLEAISETTIRSRISGYITGIPFDVGDLVRTGPDALPVVELDDSSHREQVSRAEAALNVAKAQLKAKQTTEALARTEYDRAVELSRSRVITQQELEQIHSQLAIAAAEVELEQARVSQAESDLEQSRLSLKETRISSSLPGFVAERYVEVGDLANPTDPLLRIVCLDRVETVVHVGEKDYHKLQPDQPATIEVDAFPRQKFSGRVTRKAPFLDLATRTAAVHIEIPNPQGLLKPGMHARVSIVFGMRKQADVVPIAALVEDGREPSVYVVEGNPPVLRLAKVRTGIVDGESVEILSGIGPHDRVVTLGSQIAKAGQEVLPLERPLGTNTMLSQNDPPRSGSGTGD